MDNNLVKAKGGGGRDGWRWAKGGKRGDTYNNVNIENFFLLKNTVRLNYKSILSAVDDLTDTTLL